MSHSSLFMSLKAWNDLWSQEDGLTVVLTHKTIIFNILNVKKLFNCYFLDLAVSPPLMRTTLALS